MPKKRAARLRGYVVVNPETVWGYPKALEEGKVFGRYKRAAQRRDSLRKETGNDTIEVLGVFMLGD